MDELPVDEHESKVLDIVKERNIYHYGKFIGTSNYNPILNTSVSNVETPDGHISEYTENFIAKIYTER